MVKNEWRSCCRVFCCLSVSVCTEEIRLQQMSSVNTMNGDGHHTNRLIISRGLKQMFIGSFVHQ